jgi:hypothetical protein
MSKYPKIQVKHISGKANVFADQISRLSDYYFQQIKNNPTECTDMQEILDLIKLRFQGQDKVLKKLTLGEQKEDGKESDENKE